MATEQATSAARGPRDDTEEDLVGTDWHQDAIRGLRTGLRDLALRAGLPWHVGDQLTLVAWGPYKTPWRPSPDIMVHPTAGAARRKEMDTRTDGLPALIIEVASESTWRKDVDLRTNEGKARAYLTLGVPEYLVFDPLDAYIGGPCRAWRAVGGQIETWDPAPDGRYVSRALGIALRPEGALLRVFDHASLPVPFEFEKTRLLADQIDQLAAQADQMDAQAAQLDAQATQIADQEAELSRLRAELARRRQKPSESPDD